jgi:hypothetical protein
MWQKMLFRKKKIIPHLQKEYVQNQQKGSLRRVR